MDVIPTLSADLIKDLADQFPPLQPEDVVNLTPTELAMKAGRRSVVDFLLMRTAQQQEEELNV